MSGGDRSLQSHRQQHESRSAVSGRDRRERSLSPLPSGSLTAVTSRVRRRGEHDNRVANIFRMKSGGQQVAAAACPCKHASGLCTAVRSAAPAAARARRDDTSQTTGKRSLAR